MRHFEEYLTYLMANKYAQIYIAKNLTYQEIYHIEILL